MWLWYLRNTQASATYRSIKQEKQFKSILKLCVWLICQLIFYSIYFIVPVEEICFELCLPATPQKQQQTNTCSHAQSYTLSCTHTVYILYTDDLLHNPYSLHDMLVLSALLLNSEAKQYSSPSDLSHTCQSSLSIKIRSHDQNTFVFYFHHVQHKGLRHNASLLRRVKRDTV